MAIGVVSIASTEPSSSIVMFVPGAWVRSIPVSVGLQPIERSRRSGVIRGISAPPESVTDMTFCSNSSMIVPGTFHLFGGGDVEVRTLSSEITVVERPDIP